jgi:hypothetical protein
LALWGGLSTPIALAAGTLMIVLFGSKHGDVWSAALLGAAFLLVLGTVLSIMALVRISRSRGRLHGTGWAVAGVVLGPILLLAFGFLAVVAVVEWTSSPPEEAPYDIEPSQAENPDLNEVIAFVPAVPPASSLPQGARREGVPAAAVKVVGGPERLLVADRARIAAQVEALWTRLVPVIESEPNPDVKRMHLAPADRATVEAMSPEERKLSQGFNRLGLPFHEPYGSPLAPFRLAWVVLDSRGENARVVMATQTDTISFPITRVDGAWHAALGRIETGGRALQDEDRSGWLDHRWYGPPGDPAERVSGGPAGMTAAERHELADSSERAWRVVDEEHGGPLPIPLPEGTKLSKFRMYHLALEASGQGGHLVASDGTWTLAVRIVVKDERWSVLPDVTFHHRPPLPGDRDGVLNK